MDAKLLVVVCLALLGTVQGYTLRDILRERALRRLGEFDENQQFDEEETRALNRLKEFHFRRLYDVATGKGSDCIDANKDCAGFIYENGGPEEYCTDPDPYIQDYVKNHCRKTCNIDNCNGGFGDGKIPHPPAPGSICRDEVTLEKYCRILASERCHEYYVDKYCPKSCDRCL